jgi:hypothetical protein
MIMGGKGSKYPAGNFSLGSTEDGGIRGFDNGVAKNPRLCREKGSGCSKASPGVGAGTDRRDLGADIDAVEAAINGIE